MIIGRVYGSVVSTHKLEGLVGYKFMLVQCIENKNLVDKFLVAVDGVGAGIGEQVLTVSGSTARKAFGRDTVPVDAAIVAIIDTVEVNREAARGSE